MRLFLLALACCLQGGLYAQHTELNGTYSGLLGGVEVIFLDNHNFTYRTTSYNPSFYRFEPLEESGKYARSGDTIILNPGLASKPFVETAFREEKISGDSVKLMLNHIRRYYNLEGMVTRKDTSQVMMWDFAINEWNKKARRRVAPHRQVRCTFAGFIPKEIITSEKTITVATPKEGMHKIFIGCYEMQGTNAFAVTDESSNRFVLDIYSNYYEDGQIRQMKMLIRKEKFIYTHQRKNGSFETDTVWNKTGSKLKKQDKN